MTAQPKTYDDQMAAIFDLIAELDPPGPALAPDKADLIKHAIQASSVYDIQTAVVAAAQSVKFNKTPEANQVRTYLAALDCLVSAAGAVTAREIHDIINELLSYEKLPSSCYVKLKAIQTNTNCYDFGAARATLNLMLKNKNGVPYLDDGKSKPAGPMPGYESTQLANLIRLLTGMPDRLHMPNDF